jgi:hypothetical protein
MEVNPGIVTLMQPLFMSSNSQGAWPCAIAQVIIALAALTGLDMKMVSPYLVCQTIGAIGSPPCTYEKTYHQIDEGFSSPKKKPTRSQSDLSA